MAKVTRGMYSTRRNSMGLSLGGYYRLGGHPSAIFLRLLRWTFWIQVRSATPTGEQNA